MHSSSLKNATAITRASNNDEKLVQFITIYRCQFVCKNTDYKSISSKVVSSMFKLTHLASKEEKHSFLFIGKKECPQETETLHDNLMHTTLFDNDLSGNAGNNTDLLHCLMRIISVIFHADMRPCKRNIFWWRHQSQQSAVDCPVST